MLCLPPTSNAQLAVSEALHVRRCHFDAALLLEEKRSRDIQRARGIDNQGPGRGKILAGAAKLTDGMWLAAAEAVAVRQTSTSPAACWQQDTTTWGKDVTWQSAYPDSVS
jgi:hypothetical protein